MKKSTEFRKAFLDEINLIGDHMVMSVSTAEFIGDIIDQLELEEGERICASALAEEKQLMFEEEFEAGQELLDLFRDAINQACWVASARFGGQGFLCTMALSAYEDAITWLVKHGYARWIPDHEGAYAEWIPDKLASEEGGEGFSVPPFDIDIPSAETDGE